MRFCLKLKTQTTYLLFFSLSFFALASLNVHSKAEYARSKNTKKHRPQNIKKKKHIKENFVRKGRTLNFSIEKKEGIIQEVKTFSDVPLGRKLRSQQIILMDAQTGTVLLQRNADERVHPSSMTKIMTAYMAFKKLKEGTIKPDTLFFVDRDGWRVEGSSMFLSLGDQVKVEDLIKGIVIQSGNDASVVLAKGISGSESLFAQEMTSQAKEMGALSSNFVNASGLPHVDHLTTMRDLAIISLRLIQDFPQYYHIFGEKEFSYGGVKQGNRNPLLYHSQGFVCDGIKTGSTNIAGYGVVASCKREKQRLILVINGLKTIQERADEAREVISWGMNHFSNILLYKKGQNVDSISILYGSEKSLKLSVDKDILVTVANHLKKNIKIMFEYPTFVEGGIEKGEKIGKIIVSIPGSEKNTEIPLVASHSVDKCSFFKKIVDSLYYLVFGKI